MKHQRLFIDLRSHKEKKEIPKLNSGLYALFGPVLDIHIIVRFLNSDAGLLQCYCSAIVLLCAGVLLCCCVSVAAEAMQELCFGLDMVAHVNKDTNQGSIRRNFTSVRVATLRASGLATHSMTFKGTNNEPFSIKGDNQSLKQLLLRIMG
ncbi:hypothetical protein LOK49_LG10G02251 [Camellia lanceoleosa]|uniref:Uncharacterized protein n=1 Tax=Camellia lanceoleosa TaxID=1840588 RepID=A0ACC0G6E4_9ERIC|nr:hypothetical protein LOK49_LG10G02251 [Camellia lanceoleosa]